MTTDRVEAEVCAHPCDQRLNVVGSSARGLAAITLGFALAATSIGCGAAPEPSESQTTSPLKAAVSQKEGLPTPAAEVVDGAGRKFKRVREVPKVPFPGPPGSVDIPGEAVGKRGKRPSVLEKMDTLPDEELGKLMRMKMYRQGYEYIEDGDDATIGARFRQAKKGTAGPTDGHEPTEPLPKEPTPEVGSQAQPYIFGTDTRTNVSYDLSYPNSTSVNFFTDAGDGCSAVVIGRRTLATAAHCAMWNGWIMDWNQSWMIPVHRTSPTNSTTPFGVWGLFDVYIPGCWDGSDGHWDCDMAMVQMWSNQPIGNTTGWMGTLYTLSELDTAMRGYSGDLPHPNVYYRSGWLDDAGEYRHEHYLDIFPGDSGSGHYDPYSNRIIGVMSTESHSCFLWWCDYWNETTAWNWNWHWWFASTGVWPSN